ncbi:MAG: hypothetical protein EOS65_02545 [Mesorhizobium sp.]|uniref:hypothetical protein n=1 Tax=Mesorhizobium sp. TaxID=1871066 RepID=UPI000FE6113C|nr:hypothetical protein [Mesorhizobium sp.]RWF44274.1 MAG: hypothetical protein EOS65_02545 [Mesorhizobium sp.]
MAKPKAKAAAANGPSEREQWEEQQFLNGFRQIKDIRSNIAAEMGDAKDIYDRIKKAGGFTKADIKWALELDDKDATEIIATMKRRLRIARMFGHGVARQIEMFDADRTPADDRAYGEGLAAGKLRRDASNPYGADSPQGQAWQRGMNDGTEFINRDLADQFETDEGGDEIIKAADPGFGEDGEQREAAE